MAEKYAGGRITRTVTVRQLKRYGYSAAVTFALLSMGVTLLFDSPTFSLSPSTRTFDYWVYPVLIVVGVFVIRAIMTGRLAVEKFEKVFVVFFAVFFVSKFSLTLVSAPTLLSLAYVESWYWMMVGVWAVSFLAFSFRLALFLNVAVYTATVSVIVTNTWLKAGSDVFHELLSGLLASNFRFAAVLAILVVLGYVKQQWVLVEQEAMLLRSMAHVDALTGLPNRRRSSEVLHDALANARGPVSVILFDLDGFKQINDRFGHHVGDDVLRSLGRLARRSVRSSDTVGRWGGEEFVVISPDTDLAEGARLAQRLCHDLAAHRMPHGLTVTGSFGVAERRPGETAEELMMRADRALYAAKAHGKNTVYQICADNMPACYQGNTAAS